MRAQLKGLSSSDVELESFWPSDESCFGFVVEARIGPENNEGADLFQFVVCTPNWIEKRYSAQHAVWGQYMLIVFEYDLGKIKEEVARYATACVGDSWDAIAQRLGRIWQWEFEGYKP